MDVASGFADFIVHSRPTRQAAITRAAVAAIVDGIASLVRGSREEVGELMRGYASRSGGSHDCTVAGSSLKCAPPTAAYVNAASGHSLCYDDTSRNMMGHPTVVVLPAALAVGELVGAEGKEIIDSYAIGVEVAVRVSEPLGPHHYKGGWHPTGTAGVIGAAAAASRLLELDHPRTRMALGIAATSACGLRANFGSMTMIYHAGLAARGGVDAALLAARGMTSAPDPFEGPIGYFAMFGRSLSGEEVEAIVNGLGDPFELIDPGLDVKAYPCGALSHRAIDGMLELRKEYEFGASDIERIVCTLPSLHSEVLVHRKPTTVLESRLSLVYPVAVAATRGSCRVGDFRQELLWDAAIQRVMACIEIRATDAELRTGSDVFAAPVEVTVFLKDGSTVDMRVENVKGSPANPLTDDEAHAKFEDCTADILGAERAEELWNAGSQLDALDEVKALSTLLQPLQSSG